MTHWIPPSLSHRLYILRMIIIRTEPHLLNQTDRQPATQRNQTKSWTRHRASIHSRELKSQSPRHSSSSSYPFHWWPFSARHHAQLITHIELSFKRICTHVGTHHRGALNVSDTDGISYSMRLYLSTAMILEKQISEGEDDPFRKDDNSTRCSNILYDHATIKPTATQLMLKYQGYLKHETGE